MSIEKMRMITLVGPVELVDTAIRRFAVNREFHLENALTMLGEKMNLSRIGGSDPYSSALGKAISLAERLEIDLSYVDFPAEERSAEAEETYIQSLVARTLSLISERQRLSRYVQECEALFGVVSHFVGVGEKLSDLLNMKYIKFRYGKINSANYPMWRENITERNDAFTMLVDDTDGTTFVIYFVLPRSADIVDGLASSIGFERVPIDESLKNAGTAEDETARLAEALRTSKSRLLEINTLLESIKAEESEALMRAYSCMKFYSEAFSLRVYAAQMHKKFFLIGWVPDKIAMEYAAECETVEGISCFDAEDREIDFIEPPTKLKNSLLGRVFKPFLQLYGVPAYNQLDPSMFLAVTYIFIFGIMFGDVGQGLCLAAVGLVLRFWKKMWLGGIITCCGCSGAVFGFVYGSIFGNEHILPGFKILEDGNVSLLMIFSLGLGAFLLAMVMILGIVNSARRRDWPNVFFGVNGLSGLVFYLGIIVAAVSGAAFGVNLFRAFYVIPVLILPLILIMLREPLEPLFHKKDAHGEHEKAPLGGMLVTGFFELFEAGLSYLTNTLSFLRVGAYAITHVGLMLVVQMLAGEDGNIIVTVLGNIFVIGFEGMLVGIQVLRLEFYELFGRFCGPTSGREFKPYIVGK